MSELAEVLNDAQRSTLGEVYSLLLSIAAREDGNAASDQLAAAGAEGGSREPDGRILRT
jgi:hypothetical protein